MKFERFSSSVVNEEEEDNEQFGESSTTLPAEFLSSTPEVGESPQQTVNHNKYFSRKASQNFYGKKCFLVAGIFIVVFFVILGFVVLVSFIVRCDEKKLIDYFEERKSTLEKAFTQLSENWQQEELTREVGYKAQKVEWIAYEEFHAKMLEQMEPAGNERYGKHDLLLYVSRTNHMNGTVVGKYCPFFKTMYFGYAGDELNERRGFEILIYPIGTLSWIPGNLRNEVPETDLVVGGDAPISGESTYICRTLVHGYLLIGKYFTSSSDICAAAYHHKEYNQTHFEILAVNEMGRMLGVNS